MAKKASQSRDCPVCGCNSKANVYPYRLQPIIEMSILEEFNIVICSDCGMAFVDTIPKQELLDNYYKNFSKYETSIAQYSQTQKNPYKDLSEFIAIHLPNSKSVIIDIGCGNGKLLHELSSKGYSSLAGVELSEINCKRVASNGFIAINKSLFDLSQDDFPQTPDCIVLCDVLEHISDVRKAISIVSQLLKDMGILIISIPLLDNFKNTAIYPFNQISMEHVNYFSYKTLDLLMRLHGFEIKYYEEVTYDSEPKLNVVFHRLKTTNAMHDYMLRCYELLEPTIDIIDAYKKSQKPIAVYGAGTLCQFLFANTDLALCNIVCVVDGNTSYQGQRFGRCIIDNPVSLKRKEFSNVDIFTISYHHNEEITKQIRDLGLTNMVVSLP